MLVQGGARALRAALPVLLALLATHVWVNARQPAAYMDELFHAPQAAAFCTSLRDLSPPAYSSKITTPPGPYVIAALLSPLFGCSVAVLRAYAALAVALTVPALAVIAHVLLGAESTALLHDVTAWRIAAALASHPPLLFSGALFYTDAFATLFLALCWALALRDRSIASALAGVAAASMRQTSVVWHFLFALHSVFRVLRRRASVTQLGRTLLPHLAAGGLYIYLFARNGYSVAVGDQAFHALRAHWAMLPYFAGYRLLFALPALLTALGASLRLLTLAPWAATATVAATAAVLAKCVLLTGAAVHPFVLADNRHYTFYVYRRLLLRSELVRLALVVPYSAAVLLPFAPAAKALARASRIETKSGKALLRGPGTSGAVAELAMQAAAFAVTAACVVPAQLLEPRYFIQGYVVTMMIYLSGKNTRFGNWEMMLCVGFNLIVHFVLVYVFAELPFDRPVDAHMPHDLSPGRFMF